MSEIRKDCLKRWDALKRERSSWLPHWQEISEVLLPRSGRFLTTDQNNGGKRHRHILDNTGTRAIRTLAGGMLAGMTSPARPWFRLTTMNPNLDEDIEVKAWLAKVTTLMQMTFAKSNVYRALQMMYEELGAFGTSATLVLDDYDNIIHCMPLTIGEFAIATNSRGDIDTLYREFRMTVASLVGEFGYENCSTVVQQAYDKGEYDRWITVINAIEPRFERNPSSKLAKDMPFRSVYFELETGKNDDAILRETGFRAFPALAARWNVTGGDIYGTSPGMEALGDLRQLQQEQMCKAKAIAYQADPAVIVPNDFKEQAKNLVPGGVVYSDSVGQVNAVRSAYEVPLRLDFLLNDIQDVRNRINEAFYKDIFMMISSGANDRRTATEIASLNEEKMIMLGPVVERLNTEVGDRLISLTFDRLVDANVIPPIPPQLNEAELNVEFVSILAQAQRAISTNAVDRFTNNLGNLIAIKPELADKFNADYWADYYSDVLGVDPQLVVGNNQVALIRQQRAEQQAQQQRLEQAEKMAQMAPQLAQAQALQTGLNTPNGSGVM